jgi:hypothetical protein
LYAFTASDEFLHSGLCHAKSRLPTLKSNASRNERMEFRLTALFPQLNPCFQTLAGNVLSLLMKGSLRLRHTVHWPKDPSMYTAGFRSETEPQSADQASELRRVSFTRHCSTRGERKGHK